MKKLLGITVSVLGLFALAGTSQAQTIAINFSAGQYAAPAPITADTGVVSVAAADWNNEAINSGSVAAGTLIDSNGSTTATPALTYNSNDAWQSGNTGLGNLLNGYLDSANGISPTFTVTGLTYANYDVYVYVGADGDGRAGSGTIGSETLSYTTDAASATQFIVNSDPTATDPTANTLLFSGLTGSSFTYTGNLGLSNSGIMGVEIVAAVPEPSEVMLLSIGLLSLVILVRRKQAASL